VCGMNGIARLGMYCGNGRSLCWCHANVLFFYFFYLETAPPRWLSWASFIMRHVMPRFRRGVLCAACFKCEMCTVQYIVHVVCIL
jgi:hypothetical protein